jgi:hypothetical protein
VLDPETEEDIDLEGLFDQDLNCTSRSVHPCSRLATHVVRAKAPCPDSVNTIYWCDSRLKLHLSRSLEHYVCSFCGISMFECWTIRPI